MSAPSPPPEARALAQVRLEAWVLLAEILRAARVPKAQCRVILASVLPPHAPGSARHLPDEGYNIEEHG